MDDLKQLTQGLASQQAILAFAEAHPLIEAEIVAIIRLLKPDLQSRSATTKMSASAASATTATAAQMIPVGPGFLTLPDMPSLVPRGKLDVEIGEWGIALRPKLSAKEAAEGVPAPAPILLHNSNVVGVFHVAVKDKYKSGPAGLTHYVLLACSTPVMVGKTAHSVLGFSETGTAWAKLPATAVGTRAVDTGLLKDSASLTGLAGSSATSWSAPDALHLLKGCLSAVYGRIGEMDRSIFVSSESASSVKCYLKANEGQLFPLRRALIWTGKPLLVLPLSAVKEIKVGRGGGARTFDLDVLMATPAAGTGKPVIYQFGMLDANELQPLSDYVSTRTLGGAAASAPVPAPTPAAVPSTAGMDSGSSGAAAQVTAPIASSAPPKAANNMNEGDSDQEEGAGGGGVDGEEDEEEDSDEEYQEGDSEEEEEYEDEEDEEDDDGDEGYGGAGSSGAGRGKKPQKPQVDSSDTGEEGEEEGGEVAASGADEDDEDEDLGDDEDDDDLAALLEDAGEDAAPARRRAGAGGAGSASSSSAAAAVEGEEEAEQSWADKLKSRKRRAAAGAATSSAAGTEGPSSAAAAPATDDEAEEGPSTKMHRRV